MSRLTRMLAGRRGGRSRSPAKLAAQRMNCLKGGRPKGARDASDPSKRAAAQRLRRIAEQL